jgi:DNA/RNA endonuclease G (NUC1)
MSATKIRLCGLSLLAAIVALIPAQHSAGETQKAKKKVSFPKACPALWQGVGRPQSTDGRDAIFLCYSKYVVSHNNEAKTPDWVIERLHKKHLGDHQWPRPGFRPDLRVPKHGRAADDDYGNVGPDGYMARGHMAPAEDFDYSRRYTDETFFLTNAVPQIGVHFNGSIWKYLEEQVRDAARKRTEIRIISGPVRSQDGKRAHTIKKSDNRCDKEIVLEGPPMALICKEHNNKQLATSCTTGVNVPIALYKIVYDTKSGTAHAFVLPNKEHPNRKDAEARQYLEDSRTTVVAIEQLTGLKFFLNLKGAKRKRVVEECAPDPLWQTSP